MKIEVIETLDNGARGSRIIELGGSFQVGKDVVSIELRLWDYERNKSLNDVVPSWAEDAPSTKEYMERIR